MMSTASWLATSPAAAPPMPSHTAKSVAVRADRRRRGSPPCRPRARLREVGDEEVVLVVLADLADVGAREELDREPRPPAWPERSASLSCGRGGGRRRVGHGIRLMSRATEVDAEELLADAELVAVREARLPRECCTNVPFDEPRSTSVNVRARTFAT